MNAKEWLLNWFTENSSESREVLEANLDVNYFNAGYIDSFVFISLVGDLEEAFEIEFDNDQFLNRDFATINGLAAIISDMVE